MISIIVLYSPDRNALWNISRACLMDCLGFNDCQLIVSCDRDSPKPALRDSTTIVVPRRNSLYCWADAINAGIACADFDQILYLDCDRILPTTYLKSIMSHADEGCFLYSSALYRMNEFESLETVRGVRDGILPLFNYAYPDYRFPHDYDPRKTGIQAGKGPFSGNCSFSKSAYRESGGVDPLFIGAGYVDQEYWFRCRNQGFAFKALPCNEIHLYHPGSMFNRLDGVWNCHYMARKHNLFAAHDLSVRIKKAEAAVGDLSSFPSCREYRTKMISLIP